MLKSSCESVLIGLVVYLTAAEELIGEFGNEGGLDRFDRVVELVSARLPPCITSVFIDVVLVIVGTIRILSTSTSIVVTIRILFTSTSIKYPDTCYFLKPIK